MPITRRTAARLLAEHVRDTSTVGAVLWHPERHTRAAPAGAVLLLVIAVLLLIGAAL